MHPKEITFRSQQLDLLSQIAHQMNTAPEIGRLLEKIMRHPDYDLPMSFKREAPI